MSTLFIFDQDIKSEGFSLLCGVDEVGRGPMAGPVYAAAVVLNEGFEDDRINDSKKLSDKKREILAEIIKSNSAWSIASASVEEIERINILEAALLAMKRAVEGLGINPDLVLVDGNRLPKLGCNARFVVGGDQKSAAIAAASIIAKVERDTYMLNLSKQYPQYLWDKNKGYPTAEHFEAVEAFGACCEHRRSFFKKHEQKIGRAL